ncbi:MAG: Lrp/AsnC family transcriptional regulator [Candidatus Spyradocola sp.]
MTLTQEEMKVLQLVWEDSRVAPADAAVMLGMTEQAVREAIEKLEQEKVIVGYPALINWDKTPIEKVKAVIEVKVTPQRDMGFDAIAARIYRFDEVKAVYLMSGAYDLMLEVQADNLRTLASFVSQKLSTIDNVLSTATHFVLKKYKVDGVILEEDHADGRLAVSP